MSKKIASLPDAELEIMQVIWHGKTPISTSQVNELLNQNRKWSVSALQTLLNRLIARGFLSSKKDGKNRYYEILVSEADYLANENHLFLERVNSSSLTKFVAALYNGKKVSTKELDELHQFIDDKKSEV